MIRSKDPVPGSTLHDQPSKIGPSLRSSGKVEAVKLRRRSRKHPELLLFKGDPASKHCTAKSVLVNIVPPNSEVPSPWIDPVKGRIHLFYASAEHPDVLALAGDPASCVCYLWISADDKHSHAWLVKSR